MRKSHLRHMFNIFMFRSISCPVKIFTIPRYIDKICSFRLAENGAAITNHGAESKIGA